MASITIRNLDETTKQRLRLMAAHNGRSMEEQARQILTSALRQGRGRTKRKETLAEAFRSIFEPLGGVELELPPRDQGRDPPTFD
jgi:plasmid stability protein